MADLTGLPAVARITAEAPEGVRQFLAADLIDRSDIEATPSSSGVVHLVFARRIAQ